MNIINNEEQPLYTIGVIAELIGVHPETLRVWERNKLIKPSRHNKQRLYSNNDLKRLKFILHKIKEKGLNVAGVRQVIEFYPCWFLRNCRGGRAKNVAEPGEYARPCWKYDGTYCVSEGGKEECEGCEFCPEAENCEVYHNKK